MQKMADFKFGKLEGLTDFRLVLDDGTVVPVHKVLLAATSGFFDKLFDHEKASSNFKMPFKELDQDIFFHFLNFAYTMELPQLNKCTILDCLILAHYIDAPEFREALISNLFFSVDFEFDLSTSPDDVIKFAEDFQIPDLKQACLKYKGFGLGVVDCPRQ